MLLQHFRNVVTKQQIAFGKSFTWKKLYFSKALLPKAPKALLVKALPNRAFVQFQYSFFDIDFYQYYIDFSYTGSHPLYGVCFYRSGLRRCRAVRALDAFAPRSGIVR